MVVKTSRVVTARLTVVRRHDAHHDMTLECGCDRRKAQHQLHRGTSPCTRGCTTAAELKRCVISSDMTAQLEPCTSRGAQIIDAGCKCAPWSATVRQAGARKP